MLDLNELLSGNTLVVLLATSLLGLSCGVIGTFAVLRGRSLIGDALAHASLPGICISYLIFQERSFLLLLSGALVFGLLSVLCIAFIKERTLIKEDAAIAVSLSSFFGLGIALSRIVQNQPQGNRAGLDDFIFGKAASIVTQDMVFIAAVSGITLLIVALLTKEFKVLCFDREFAVTQGYPVKKLDLLLMTLIGLCVISGLPAVGVVLVSALLIFPAVTARLWSSKLELVLVMAGFFGALAAVLGTVLSAAVSGTMLGSVRGLPTGPVIVLSAAAIFLLSLLFAPQHGIVSRLLTRMRR